MPDKIEQLYGKLDAIPALVLPGINEFRTVFENDPKRAEKYFNNLTAAEGPDIFGFKTFDELYNDLGLKKKEPTTPATSNTGSNAPLPKSEQPQSTLPSSRWATDLPQTNFERRLYDEKAPVINNADGSYSTHKMESAEVDGQQIAYPTIVEKNGKLKQLSSKEAFDFAIKTGEYKKFDTQAEAQKYAEGGYKAGTILEEKKKPSEELMKGYGQSISIADMERGSAKAQKPIQAQNKVVTPTRTAAWEKAYQSTAVRTNKLMSDIQTTNAFKVQEMNSKGDPNYNVAIDYQNQINNLQQPYVQEAQNKFNSEIEAYNKQLNADYSVKINAFKKSLGQAKTQAEADQMNAQIKAESDRLQKESNKSFEQFKKQKSDSFQQEVETLIPKNVKSQIDWYKQDLDKFLPLADQLSRNAKNLQTLETAIKGYNPRPGLVEQAEVGLLLPIMSGISHFYVGMNRQASFVAALAHGKSFEDAVLSSEIYVNKPGSVTEFMTQRGQGIDKAIAEYSQLVNESREFEYRLDPSKKDSWQEQIRSTTEDVVASLGYSVPVIFGFLSGNPGLLAATNYALFNQVAESRWNQIKDDPNKTTSMKFLDSFSTATAEVLFEQLGAIPIAGLYSQIGKTLSKEVFHDMFAEVNKTAIKSWLAQNGMALSFFGEGAEELWTGIAQRATDYSTMIKKPKDANGNTISFHDYVYNKELMKKEFIVGSYMGTIFVTPAAIAGGSRLGLDAGLKSWSMVKDVVNRNKVKTLTQKFEQIQKDIDTVQDPLLQTTLVEQAKKLNEEIVKTANKDYEEHAAIPREEREKIDVINTETDQLKAQLEENKDLTPESKATVEKQIKDNEEVVKNIKDAYETADEDMMVPEDDKQMFQGRKFIEETGLRPGLYTQAEVDAAKAKKEEAAKPSEAAKPAEAPIETPEGFKNRVHEGGIALGEPTEKSHITEEGYTYRSVGPSEVNAILETGGVHAREGKAKGGNKNVKYWSRGNNQFFYNPKDNQEVIRVKNENLKENEVVTAENLEIWDKSANKFVPFTQTAKTEAPTTIPTDLEEKGTPVENRMDAEKLWSDGYQMFVKDEQNEEFTPVTSKEMLDSSTPDQLIAYPPQEDVKHKPAHTPEERETESKLIEAKKADIERRIEEDKKQLGKKVLYNGSERKFVEVKEGGPIQIEDIEGKNEILISIRQPNGVKFGKARRENNGLWSWSIAPVGRTGLSDSELFDSLFNDKIRKAEVVAERDYDAELAALETKPEEQVEKPVSEPVNFKQSIQKIADGIKEHVDFTEKYANNTDKQNRELAFEKMFNDVITSMRKENVKLYTQLQTDDSYKESVRNQVKELIQMRTGERSLVGKKLVEPKPNVPIENAKAPVIEKPSEVEQPTVQGVEPTTLQAKPTTKEKISLIDDELDGLFKKLMNNKLKSGVDPENLAVAIQITNKFIQKGILKFKDIMEMAVEKYGDAIANIFPELKQGYLAYWGTSDNQDELSDPKEVSKFDIKPLIEQYNDNRNRTNGEGANPPKLAGGVHAELPEGNEGERTIGGVSNAKGGQGRGAGTKPISGGEESGRGTGNRERDNTLSEPGGLNKNNHVIEAKDEIVPKGEITRIKANIDAIKLAKQIKSEDRLATEAEKKILAQYVGWGGLANVLNDSEYRYRQYNENWNKKYAKYYEELKELLTPDEWYAAVNSTINAHYTDRAVIEKLWDLAGHLGFKGGSFLETSAGVGHFFGLMPKAMAERSTLAGYELDKMSGLIASILYPDAAIRITGYENAVEKDNSQDLIMSNVPFAKDAPFDENNKDLSKFNLHNYFIAKSLRKLKPGGLGIFITSSSSMDGSSKFREWTNDQLGGNSDFVGAIRLPNNMFSENANTQVTTDIVIYRKRDGINTEALNQRYKNTVPIATRVDQVPVTDKYGRNKFDKAGNQLMEDKVTDLYVNEFFAEFPGLMLGEMMWADEAGRGGLYNSMQPTLNAAPGQDTMKLLEEAINAMPTNIFGAEVAETLEAPKQAELGMQEGSFVVEDGTLYQVDGGQLVKPEWANQPFSSKIKETKGEVFKKYLDIKNTAIELREAELSNADNIEAIREKLNQQYDAFEGKYGTFNKNKLTSFIEEDPEYMVVYALENEKQNFVDGKKVNEITKSDIFNKRVNFPVQEPTKADNVTDALNISLSYRGKLDLPYIAQMTGMSEAEAKQELINSNQAFENPVTLQLENTDSYLSGFVRTKLKQAEKAAVENADYQRNVDALKTVVPPSLPAQAIEFRLGSTWIPAKYVIKFIQDFLGVNVNVEYLPSTGTWVGNFDDVRYDARNRTTYGTNKFTGAELVEYALNLRQPVVQYTVKNPDGTTTTVKDAEATAEAQSKMQDLMDLFYNEIKGNEEVIGELADIYNDFSNDFIEGKRREPVFKHFPNSNEAITMRSHQKKAAVRGTTESVLLAHEVGTGKTFTMITIAMEKRRLGIAKKPMIVVQNATVDQFAKDFKLLYPGAKILVPTKKERDGENRQKLFNKIAYGDWDAVIIPQSFLDFIPDDEARETAYMNEQIQQLQQALEDSAGDRAMGNDIRKAIKSLEKSLSQEGEGKNKKTRKTKDLAKQNKRIEKVLSGQKSRRKDNVLTFEKMGIDALIIDEAHAYKKLGFFSKMSRIKGIDVGRSKRAFGLFMKVRWIQEKTPNNNVVFATGTPITNTMAEVWTMMNFVAPDIIKKYNINSFDEFASTFGLVEPSLEFTASGNFKVVERFKSYMNAPELLTAFRAKTDVVLSEDVQEFKDSNTIPKLKTQPNGKEGYTSIILPQSSALNSVMNQIKQILVDWEKLSGKAKKESSHIPLVMFTEAKQAAIDLRLLDPFGVDDPQSKTNKVVENAFRIYNETSSFKGTQMIFSDMYQSPETPVGPVAKSTLAFADEDFLLINENEKKNPTVRFNLFEDIKKKLVGLGIPADQIAIINDFKDDEKKKTLFNKVNSGEIRILLGSTEKMGVGVNAQERLAALHHVDAPPRPMDFAQRNGRILRQGNILAKMGIPVDVLTYGVEKTLDATAYQRLAIKQKFINEMMKAESVDRTMEDSADEDSASDLSFDEMMAVLSGSQYAAVHMAKKYELKKLETAKKNYDRRRIDMMRQIEEGKKIIPYLEKKKEATDAVVSKFKEAFPEGKVTNMVISGVELTDKFSDALEGMLQRLISKKRADIKSQAVESVILNGMQFNVEATRTIQSSTGIMTEGFSWDAVDGTKYTNVITKNGQQIDVHTITKQDGGINTGQGLLSSINSAIKSTTEGYIPGSGTSEMVSKRIEDNKKSIQAAEDELEKPFSKGEKLVELRDEVADLEEKMKAENGVEETEDEEVEYEEDRQEYNKAIQREFLTTALNSTIGPDGLGIVSRVEVSPSSTWDIEDANLQDESFQKLKKIAARLQMNKSGYTNTADGTSYQNMVRALKEAGLDSIYEVKTLGAKKWPSGWVTSGSHHFVKKSNGAHVNTGQGSKLMRTSKGAVYGAYDNGTVYIDPNVADATTPIHEYGHSFMAMLKAYKPEVFERGIELIQEYGKSYVDEIRNNPAYDGLSEEDILEEALVRAIADEGAKLSADTRSGFDKWLADLYDALRSFLGFDKASTEDLKNMNLNQFIGSSLKTMFDSAALANIVAQNPNSSVVQTSPKFSINENFMIPSKVWNQAMRIMNSLKDDNVNIDAVINAGVSYIKDNVEGWNNEDSFRQFLSRKWGATYQSDEMRMRKTTQRVMADETMPDEIKNAFTEKTIYYDRLPMAVTAAEAESLIRSMGVDAAYNAVLDTRNGMYEATRTALAAGVIKQLQRANERDRVAEFMEAVVARFTELGQGINAIKLFREFDSLTIMTQTQKILNKIKDTEIERNRDLINSMMDQLRDLNATTIEEVIEKISPLTTKAEQVEVKDVKRNVEYGSENKVVTKSAYEQAKNALKRKFFSAFVPPPELITVAAYHLEASSRSFANWTRNMVEDLGDKVKPHLVTLYKAAKAQLINDGASEEDFLTDKEIEKESYIAQATEYAAKLEQALVAGNKAAWDKYTAKLQKVADEAGLWPKYRNIAARRLAGMTIANIEQDIKGRPILKEFTDLLIANMTQRVKEAMGVETKRNAPAPAINVIADAYKNVEKYQDVWERARVAITKKYADNPEQLAELDQYFGTLLETPFSRKLMQRAIKETLRNQFSTSINEIIRTHYSVLQTVRQDLADMFVEYAGLTEPQATDLANKVKREFDSLVTEKKQKLIASMLKSPVTRKSTAPKGLEEELIKLTNVGAFSDAQFLELYAKKHGWGVMTAEQVREIENLSNAIQTAENDLKRFRAIEDLLKYQAGLKGSDWTEIALGIWYANILSGYTTQEVNIGQNFINMLTAGFNQTLANPKGTKLFAKALYNGIKIGFSQAYETMATGYSPIRGKVEVPSILERVDFWGGAYNPANYLKFVRRFMVASDVVFFEGLKEMRLSQLAYKLAKQENQDEPSRVIMQKAVDIMNYNSTDLQEAQERAAEDMETAIQNIKGNSKLSSKQKEELIKQEKSDLVRNTQAALDQLRRNKLAGKPDLLAMSVKAAAKGTYNYKPEGILGFVVDMLNQGKNNLQRKTAESTSVVEKGAWGSALFTMNMVVPFTNIVANVFNETINYSPLGLTRLGDIKSAKGVSDFEKKVLKQELLIKAALGTTAMAVAYILSNSGDDDDDDSFRITANGTGDYRKNYILKETGWQPFSVKIGDKWISYQYTPFFFPLMIIGNMNDYTKYRGGKDLDTWAESRLVWSMAKAIPQMMQTTFLQGLTQFMDYLTSGDKNLAEDALKSVPKTLKSFYTPNLYEQVFNEVQRHWEMPEKNASTITAQMIKDIPVAKNQLYDKLNVLGEPVLPDTDKFVSSVTSNKAFQLLVDKGAWLTTPRQNTSTILEMQDGKIKERVMTDEEFYNYAKMRGDLMKGYLLNNYDNLNRLDAPMAKKLIESTWEKFGTLSKDMANPGRSAFSKLKGLFE